MGIVLISESSLAADQQFPIPEETPLATLEFANGLYSRKMYGPAIAEYDKFIRANPKSPDLPSAKFRKADSYYFSENYHSAIDYFSQFIKESSQDKRLPMAKFRIATANYHLKQTAEAIREFLELSKNANDPIIQSGSLFYLGQSYESKQKIEKAWASYDEILKRFPETEYAVYAAMAIGDAALRNSDLEKALKSYQVAARKEEPFFMTHEARYKIAEIALSQKNYALARTFYERVYADAQAKVSAASTDVQSRRILETGQKSLVALFYCDYYESSLQASIDRLEASKAYFSAHPKIVPEIWFIHASLLVDQKKESEADALLDQVVLNAHASQELKEKALFKRSIVLNQLHQSDGALALLEKILAIKPKQIEKIYFQKASVLQSQGKLEEALSIYELLNREHPQTEFGRLALYEAAVIQTQLKRVNEARAGFLNYQATYPEGELSQKALLQVLQLDIESQNYQAAMEQIKRFQALYPNSSMKEVVLYKKGIIHTALKEYDLSGASFEAIGQQSSLYPESLYGRATNLEAEGKLSEAIASYEKFMSIYPDHSLSSVIAARQVYLYLKTDQPQKASAFLQDVLLTKPSIPVDAQTAFWLVQYWLDQSRYEDMQKALAMLPARLGQGQFSHEILFFLGESYMGLKNFNRAIEYYSKSIEINPEGSYVAHAYLGRGIAALALQDIPKAQMNFSEAIKFDEDVKVAMRARFELAGLWLRAGDYLEAANAFMRVAIFYDDPKITPLSLYKAAECFSKVGRSNESRQAIEELKNRYPESQWAKEVEPIGTKP